jgi:hypothetical protein
MTHPRTITLIATIAVAPLVAAAFARSVRPAESAPDPWAVTADDDAAALDVYRRAAGNLDDKLRSAVKADRLRVKSRVVAETARPARRVWLDTTDGKALIDLNVYTSVVIGATEVEFRESGFTTLRVPRSDAVVSHLRAYYGGVELGGSK